MPLLDHFHPPLFPRHSWESFHSNWATRLADAITNLLPPDFIVEENTHGGGRLEIDVAAYEQPPEEDPHAAVNGAATSTLVQTTWTPATATQTMPAVFPDSFEVRVFSTSGGLTLVAAIELISPGNKDRPEERRAFAAKCASYLHKGVAVIVMDVVTSRKANLHNEIMRLMNSADEFLLPAEVDLYAVAYRPVLREERAEIDLWKAPCAIGQPLPLLPLRLTGDLFVPVDFEAAYQEACRRRRLI
jgi:hypothetical protein